MLALRLEEQQYQSALDIGFKFLNDPKVPANLYAGIVTAYRQLHDSKNARKYLDIGMGLFPDGHKDFNRMHADLLAEENPASASLAYDEALKVAPDDIAAKWNKSFVDLRLGKFSSAWDLYEYGLDDRIGKIGRPIPKIFSDFKRLRSYTESPENDPLIVVAEQGIGDQIIFLSCLQEVLAYRKDVIYICERRFAPIIRRSFPEISVYEYGAPALIYELLDRNGYLAVGSLMKEFRRSLKNFLEAKRNFLTPNYKLVNEYRDALVKNSNGKKIIGLSWKGGFWERAQKSKTIELQLWEPLLKREDCMFVNLQYGDCSSEQAYIRENGFNVRFIKGIDFKSDLDGWFALGCACDSVISVSTAIVHFLGAAGKKVDLLLNGVTGPFIWGLEEGSSCIYTDVNKHRVRPGEEFKDFFERMSKELVI
jgi:tetratricopeptide (TPR) repeat protein